MQGNKAVYTIEEGCRLLDISRPTLRNAIRNGRIPHARFGRRILIPKGALDRILAGEQATNDPRPAA